MKTEIEQMLSEFRDKVGNKFGYIIVAAEFANKNDSFQYVVQSNVPESTVAICLTEVGKTLLKRLQEKKDATSTSTH
jgi:hypothetical protein